LQAARRLIVRALNGLCGLVDAVAYRPVVVRFGRPLPHRWNCNLARLSMRLDERWGTGYWNGDGPQPGEPCEACGRRPALFFIGGYADDPDLEEPVEVGDDDYFFAHREVALCGWCKLPPHDAPFGSEAELQQALRAAAERSTRWGWRWRPTWE